ncbi:MAG: 3'-5' exoribonuclease [Mycolicibacterium frederiksbergense]|nr:3'-5' exoribonuclease [Mycolicibacterium frederiksbergense]
MEDGKTIELISIGIVCEDGREYYAVNSDMPTDRIHKNEWLVNNVWKHLPVRGLKTSLAGPAGNIREVVSTDGHLDTSSTLVKPKWVIRNEVRQFLLASVVPAGQDDTGEWSEHGHPELWAYYAAYDHVVLSQLWGPMMRLPEGIPMYTHDLKQEMDRQGVPSSTVPQPDNAHDALADARWNMAMHKVLHPDPHDEAAF